MEAIQDQRYRVTKITTTDYGPDTPEVAEYQLSRIPDGRHWSELPAVILVGRLPYGTEYGDTFTLSIERDGA